MFQTSPKKRKNPFFESKEKQLKDIDDSFVRDIEDIYKDKTELSDIYNSILENIELVQWLHDTLDSK